MSAAPFIVAETPSWVAVAKPYGMHTAPLLEQEPGTLVEWIVKRYPEIASVRGRKAVEPGLLHRLDLETSGLVIFARSDAAFASLMDGFDGEHVVKTYSALCGVFAGPTMLSPSGMSAEEWAQVLREAGGRGGERFIRSRFRPYGPGAKLVRPSLEAGDRNTSPLEYKTRFTVRRIEAGRGPFEKTAFVEASITRGFRHQIRVHLASIGLPILGDPLYAPPNTAEGETRMYLHASSLAFPDPDTGKTQKLECPPEFEAKE